MNTVNTIIANTTPPINVEVVGNYYIHSGCFYDIHFPLHYAMNHKEGTGPKECSNCAYYGSWRGSFIGYCDNCADVEYNLERGYGFCEWGVENYYVDRQGKSHGAFDTYLKNVNLDKIGHYDEGHPYHLLDHMGFPVHINEESQRIIDYIDVRALIRDNDINPDYLPEKIITALRNGDVKSFFKYDGETQQDFDFDYDGEIHQEFDYDDSQSEFDYDIQNKPAFKEDTENRVKTRSMTNTKTRQR